MATEAATKALTRDGVAMGTIPYMSPEQVQGKEVDHRSDIFSLGIVLYEMSTGQLPFDGETSADLISSILRDNPDSVTDLRLELPDTSGASSVTVWRRTPSVAINRPSTFATRSKVCKRKSSRVKFQSRERLRRRR